MSNDFDADPVKAFVPSSGAGLVAAGSVGYSIVLTSLFQKSTLKSPALAFVTVDDVLYHKDDGHPVP